MIFTKLTVTGFNDLDNVGFGDSLDYHNGM